MCRLPRHWLELTGGNGEPSGKEDKSSPQERSHLLPTKMWLYQSETKGGQIPCRMLPIGLCESSWVSFPCSLRQQLCCLSSVASPSPCASFSSPPTLKSPPCSSPSLGHPTV